MLNRITQFVAALRRVKRATRLLRSASSAYEERRFAEAAEILHQARDITDPPGTNWMLTGVQHANRLRFATLASMTAAKLEDRRSAVDAIQEGLRLWAEVKNHMRPSETVRRMLEWEAWGMKYAATEHRE